MVASEFLQEVELRIRSRYALIIVETDEKDRAETLLKRTAAQLSLPFYTWTRSKGLRKGMHESDPRIDDTKEAARALAMAELEGSGIFHFAGLGPFLEDPLIASHTRDVVLGFGVRRGTLVISGHDVRLPDGLRPHATTLRLGAPEPEEYRVLLERLIQEHTARMALKVDLSPAGRQRLLKNLAGLTLLEADKVLTRLMIEDGRLTESDIPQIITAKRQAVQQDGLLEYHPAREGLSQVAGMAGLKTWLGKRKGVLADPDRAASYGLPFPRGVLLLGVPGCGKSLFAKAVAREWELPLLKLDPANLYDKYVGDSEKNFKRAMRTAEHLAPIVLWIDELEKAFAFGGTEDGGVSKRVFGTFLSWLQDRRGDVFVVATANDVTALPPEFIRKGRFDEIFFVDLPRPSARREMFDIHLRKRNQDPAKFDLDAVVVATEGFSGAEIEQTIVSGLYSAFACGTGLTSDILVAEAENTHPLSRTMEERLDALRTWARHRAVSAD